MANALYDFGRQGFLEGAIDWDTDDIRLALVSSGYTPNLATDDFVADLGANIVARSGAFASKTVAAGVADAADVTLTAVTGSQATRIAIFKHTGSDATARLIALIDTATGLPVTPNGGDIVIQWDNGANRIFKL